jgi:hypothetical protein
MPSAARRLDAYAFDSDGSVQTFVRARAYEFQTSVRMSGTPTAKSQERCGHRPGVYRGRSRPTRSAGRDRSCSSIVVRLLLSHPARSMFPARESSRRVFV